MLAFARSPILLRQVAQRQLSVRTDTSSLWNRYFNIPKGFRKHFDRNPNKKNGEKPGEKGSDKKGEGPKGNNKKGDNDGGDDDEMISRILKASGIMVLGFIGLSLYDDFSKGNEISWHDVQHKLLPSKSIERIIVYGKKEARVFMKADAHILHMPHPTAAPETKPEAEKQHVDEPHSFEAPTHQPAAENSETLIAPLSHNAGPSRYFFTIGSVDAFERGVEEAQVAANIPQEERIPVLYREEKFKLLGTLLPYMIGFGLLAYFMTRSAPPAGLGGLLGGMKPKRIKKDLVNVRFSDVAGCDEAKKEIMEFVQFLKKPEKFLALGAKIPKGALLSGPPGTGKTLLAKATAGEADVPFFSVSGSEFVELFVGMGAKRVRELFSEARANAPCIIFIDEIDAIGQKRSTGRGPSGGHDERESTLNQLLVEMDGFDERTNIVILGGTNRADTLDDALMRAGRFDRQITLSLPDIKGRKELFQIYLKKLTLEVPADELCPRLAALTPGFSGAEIANLCNEAAINAGRLDKKAITMQDFEAATDRIIGGLETNRIISPEEKKIVAFHEAGHAIAGWYLQYADPLLKVTIVPRDKGSLGYAQYLPKELNLRTKEQLMDMICKILAGRAAEQVHFGSVTTGAHDDLKKITEIVYHMVEQYGMSDKVGQVCFPPDQYGNKKYSDTTALLIDDEVRAIIDAAYIRTVALMEEKKEDVRKVAELLLEKETITHFDIEDLVGKRKFSAGKEYDEYVQYHRKDSAEAMAKSLGEVVVETKQLMDEQEADKKDEVKKDHDSNNVEHDNKEPKDKQ